MAMSPEEKKRRKAESHRREYLKNKARYQERAKIYNIENKAKRDAYNKERYKKIRVEENARRILKQFGLTKEQFDALLVKQENRCAICSKHFVTDMQDYGVRNKKDQRPHIDHDHATGKVRGLLCSVCNLGLGSFSDNVATLVNAACYLEKPPNG